MQESKKLIEEWSKLVGGRYGSEAQSLLFYSLVKMHKPKNVLELGTGLGVTAFWIAQALSENGNGHIWTIDDGSHWDGMIHQLAEGGDKESAASRLVNNIKGNSTFNYLLDENAARTPVPSYEALICQLAEQFSLNSHLTFMKGAIPTKSNTAASEDPFLGKALEQPLDLLFCDFAHGPTSVLMLLAKFLPSMAESSSIFIDSASTYFRSFMVLEQTINQLQNGKIPALFLAGMSPDKKLALMELVMTRRFTLIPLVEKVNRAQNGLIWLKIEPYNFVPYPLTGMRDMFGNGMIEGEALEYFFSTGKFGG